MGFIRSIRDSGITLRIPREMPKSFKVTNFLWAFSLRSGVITTAIIDILYVILLLWNEQWIFGLFIFLLSVLLGLSTISQFKLYRIRMISVWLWISGIYLLFAPCGYLVMRALEGWVVADSNGHTVQQFFQHLAFIVFSWGLHVYFYRIVYSFYGYNRARFLK